MNLHYCTRKLVVAFDCSSDKIHCVIYRKGTPRTDHWKVLQSYTMQRKGFKHLDSRTQKACLRQVLKVMRNRITQALHVALTTKDMIE
ncbi:hypothetical protein pEaSNUABM50_00010 [Erwinia phage pEa_SNUABM_50]|uniref:Uncharacterized protein n=4 Tax=Eneladusvirus BF TaxID=2560751 RepID=A0A7L8ZLZ5_9CAUD|nr:hypothetical protein FDH34_gp011 [Serratia phage BF]QOI70949.1 hypothetical protein pEaSNUABM12_00011 [Erwinia phage pEa_SNUABM_12]QOI71494.1 hypothetical protein pEaSNUABM47_00010 [Erwinia phage pEa_SNUABM_47]QOI72034.1 hypothetical protein pEaSNUABM50_00010 [Erwinia phage pEa_SNUABM_50]QXO11157.1 hypothetical protein pEaSNUABM19_00011 [Erwinia phage pEa_SNUABM_19]QXO11706.1 hypothetical protein pEaSNUABM44_00010 [Erwinia phage pEa_SNUABM_44]QXO12257.1 hypothetical protein pEaSNUABM49_000